MRYDQTAVKVLPTSGDEMCPTEDYSPRVERLSETMQIQSNCIILSIAIQVQSMVYFLKLMACLGIIS